MEQVVELFGRYRSREIGLQALTGTLKNFLLHHPQAPKQGLGWLDLAQQRYPLPVTDFIQLRAEMDYVLRSLALQAPTSEAETTRIAMTAPQAGPGDTLLPSATPTIRPSDDTLATRIAVPPMDHDATHMAIPPEDSEATRMAAPADDGLATRIAAPTMDDAATVIAPAAPRNQDHGNEATVLAPPLPAAEPTVIAASLSANTTEATRIAAPPVTGREALKMPHSQRVPPRTVTVTPPAPAPRSATPVMGIIGGIALALVVVGGFTWWRQTDSTAPTSITPEKVAVTSSLSTVLPADTAGGNTGSAPGTSNGAEMAITTDNETVTLKLEIDDTPAVVTAPANASNPGSDAGMNTAGSVQPKPQAEPVEPLPSDVAGLLAAVTARIEKGRLLPADDPNSATFAIKQLIARAPDDNATGEARKRLSQAHLELARQARESGDLEAAQTHLDNAFDVRLMK